MCSSDLVSPGIDPTPAAGVEHAIAKGETFAVLAKKYNVSVKAIEAANPGVDPKKLKIGQKINIPGRSISAPPHSGGTSTTGAPAPDAGAAPAGKVYVVKSGDNLAKIAKAHGVSVKALQAANKLKTTAIKVGDKLSIPEKAAPAAPAGATTGGPALPPPPPVTAPPISAPPLPPPGLPGR